MCWRDGISENALAGMERFGTLARGGFGDVATRAGSCGLGCGGGGKFQRREVIDGPGPGQLKIFQRGIFLRGGDKLGPWREQ